MMIETEQELPDFEETYSLYDGRRPEVSDEEEIPQEKLQFQDREAAQAKMNELASGFGNKFLYIQENSKQFPAETFRRDMYKRVNMKLAEQIVDPDIPLRIMAYKDFVVNERENAERMRFCLDRGDEDHPVAVISLSYVVNEGFNIHHRFVEPQFRGKQGIGNMLLQCAESFAKNFATDGKEKVSLFAGMAQLDVIYWFWKNGYRPEGEQDWERLDMIINGDENLCLDDKLYVFHKLVPEDYRYEKSRAGQVLMDKGRRSVNPKMAFRLNMQKVFEPGGSGQTQDAQAEIRDEIEKLRFE